jgi:50S ribosomal protein L16 3-hydroxylase
MLKRLRATARWRLEAGDMLYLPPGWAHDGVAEGEALTCSIGFRAPSRDELARELLVRLGDADTGAPGPIYCDAGHPAVRRPARIPHEMQAFAVDAVRRCLRDASSIERSLGELLSEPKARTWFDAGASLSADCGVRLDRRTRALYDRRWLYLNGEAYQLAGADATVLRRLADQRVLSARLVARLSSPSLGLLQQWCEAGWLHAAAADDNHRREGPPS